MACPLLFDRVNVENPFLLAVLGDIACWCAAGEVYQEAYFVDEDLIKYFFVILGSEAYFDELDLAIFIWKMLRIGVYDCDFVELEVPLDQGDSSSANWSVANHTHVIYVAVNRVTFHLLPKVIIQLSKLKGFKRGLLTKQLVGSNEKIFHNSEKTTDSWLKFLIKWD